MYFHLLNFGCVFLQTSGFLGNPQAEHFDWLSCSVRVRGGASDMLVIRKKGTFTVGLYHTGTALCVTVSNLTGVHMHFRGGVFSPATAAEFCEAEYDEGGLRCVQDSGVLLEADLSV